MATADADAPASAIVRSKSSLGVHYEKGGANVVGVDLFYKASVGLQLVYTVLILSVRANTKEPARKLLFFVSVLVRKLV